MLDLERQSNALEIVPVPEAFGAMVYGVKWQAPSAQEVQVITRALRRHLLLVFRGQTSPTHDELDEFFRPFGRLVSETLEGNFHYKTFTDSDADQIHRKGNFNYVVNTDDGQGELVWHNDHFHRPQLKILSVLEALEFDEGAVPTQFRDMYTAYEMLPLELRAPLEYRQTINFDPRRLDLEKYPRLCDSMHPVFTPHPHSGRRALYIGDWTARIVGMEPEPSTIKLKELLRHAEENAPRYTHHWQEGDICVWDNVGLQHRRDSMPPGQRRKLRQFEGVCE